MLTVVIPTKNEEVYLPKLLASLATQTLQPKAIIVADAHSTDRTREIARAAGAQVIDGGLPGVGRNRGAEQATTPYVLFLDADVELTDPTSLARMMDGMRKRGLDIATCEVSPLEAGKVDQLLHGAYNRYAKVVQHIFPHAPGFCILVRRSVHKKIKGFDETVIFCEDHEYVQRAARVGRFGVLDVKVPVSIRRLERDGRFQTACKYVLAELHLATVGPIRHNLFNYTFGHDESKKAAGPSDD